MTARDETPHHHGNPPPSPVEGPLLRATGPNWLGLATLCQREVRRFAKVYNQTVLAPVVTSLLYLAVFVLALGGAVKSVGGVPFDQFLAPGLIMMAMVQNAFTNTASSIIIAKVQGNIVDTLMPPLSADELAFGFAAGGVIRGVVVGVACALGMWAFVPLRSFDAFAIVYHGIMASLMLSLLGIAGGIWAEKFDHMAAVTNFIITPLSFLSGTFYSLDRVPEVFRTIVHLNPFFYMIDGFRYGMTGHADVDPAVGYAVLAVANVTLWLVCRRMLSTGFRLRG